MRFLLSFCSAPGSFALTLDSARSSPQYTYESCVPYASTGTALYALNDWHTRELDEPGYPLKAHFPIEIRWTEKDDGWLSPTGQGRGCYLGAIQYRYVFASLDSLPKPRR